MIPTHALSTLAIALTAGTVVSGASFRRHSYPNKPAGWTDKLEDYYGFHDRYVALGCPQHKIDQDWKFYYDCCRPMLATQTLADDREPKCNPWGNSSSGEGEEDCEDEQEGSGSSASASVNNNPAPVNNDPAPSSSGNNNAGPAPAPSTEAPAPSEAPAPEAPAPEAPQGAGGDLITGGMATWFYQGGNPGACGEYHSDDDLIGAIDFRRYGSNFGVKSSECGRQVYIENPANGNSVVVTLVDVCPTCVNENSIDLSLGAFRALADLGAGMIGISWKHLN